MATLLGLKPGKEEEASTEDLIAGRINLQGMTLIQEKSIKLLREDIALKVEDLKNIQVDMSKLGKKEDAGNDTLNNNLCKQPARLGELSTKHLPPPPSSVGLADRRKLIAEIKHIRALVRAQSKLLGYLKMEVKRKEDSIIDLCHELKTLGTKNPSVIVKTYRSSFAMVRSLEEMITYTESSSFY